MSQDEDKTTKELSFERDSRQIPAWHVIVLSVCSFSLYNLYWLYRNLGHLRSSAQVALDTMSREEAGTYIPQKTDTKAEAEASASAVSLPLYFDESTMDELELKDYENLKQEARGAVVRLRNAGTLETFLGFARCPVGMFTAVFVVPIANLLILLRTASQFCALIPDPLSSERKNAAFHAFALALVYGATTLLYKLPGNWHLLYLTNCLSLFVAQTFLNRHWKLYENEKYLARQAFNPLELGVIIIGASLLGLVMVNPDISVAK